MIERQEIERAVFRCLSTPPTEAVAGEAERRNERQRLLYGMYAMQPGREPEMYIHRIAYWLEQNRAMEPKWLGRLAVDAACIVLPATETNAKPDITIGIGIWLAPEKQLEEQ